MHEIIRSPVFMEDSNKSYYASKKFTENDIFDNKLIFGDNLLALNALEQEYAGQVKCIYIDPPPITLVHRSSIMMTD